MLIHLTAAEYTGIQHCFPYSLSCEALLLDPLTPTESTDMTCHLPDGWTPERVTSERRKWGISDRLYPVASAPGVIAWGVPQESDDELITLRIGPEETPEKRSERLALEARWDAAVEAFAKREGLI